MTTYTLPTALLATVAVAMASKDVRYYLNGVLLTSSDGAARTVATDGHWALTAVAPEIGYDGPDVILPRAFVEAVLKAAGKKAETIELAVLPALDGDTDRQPRLSCTIGAATLTGRAIDGKFPDWRAIMPTTFEAGTYCNVQAKFYGLAAKAAEGLRASRWNPVNLQFIANADPKRASVIRFDDPADTGVKLGGVVMPIRTGTGVPNLSEPLAYCLPMAADVPAPAPAGWQQVEA